MSFGFRKNGFARTAVPFLCGAASLFLVWILDLALEPKSFLSLVLVEAGLFALACVVACAFTSGQPFRTAGLGVAGVFAAVIAEIVIHPTIEGGYERNLFPLEIAFHMLVASPSFLLIAVAWRVCFGPDTKRRKQGQNGSGSN